MKRKTRLLLTVTVAAVVLICAAIMIAAATVGERPAAVLGYIVGINEERPEYADANGDGRVNVLDVIALIKQGKMADVRLTTLTLDDGNYSLTFNENILTYTVKLPEGRPPIPRVEAEAAEGISVEINQAYIPDGETLGYAKVKVSDEKKGSNTYIVRFEKDSSVGFVLQYDDRYTFTPSYELKDGERFTFESTDEAVVSVSNSGLMTAKKLSSEPVSVNALVDGEIKDTLVIDRVEKAHINLFLVTGQSNAQGCYSNTTANDPDLLAVQLANVERIGQSGIVYSYDFHPRKSNTEVYNLRYTLYDMNSVSKQGFQNSLGKKWYELSGEKVVFLQTAYTGAPIQSWLDTETHDEAGKYGGRNYYDDTQKAYADLMPLLADNYEIIRTANFWNQGGTAMASIYSHELGNYINSGDAGYDPSKLMTAEEYYDLFMLMHEDMKREFGIEFCGIFLNRVTPGATSAENKALQSHTDMVPIRGAQYGLHNTIPEVSLVSRVGDYAKRTTWADKTDPGWGFVDTDNTHFTQIGYNERGRVAAESAFAIWMGNVEAESVEIVATNGRDRLTSADTIELKEGGEYILAGYALPMGSGAKTVLTSSNPKIASVDKYGIVRGNAAGNAVITATTENGITESVNFYVYKTVDEAVTYRWDFNDLTSSMAKNDLTVSPCSVALGADKNYTINDGIYSVTSAGSVQSARPDFEMEKPVTLTSDNSWSIEWRGMANTYGVLMGPSQTDPESDVSAYPFIYIYFNNKYGDYGYPLKIALNAHDTNNIFLDYGDYRTLNKLMNTWRLEYDASAKTMSLYFYNTETALWETVDTASTGKFDMTFSSLFGRARGNGELGYYGDMDYIQVDFRQEYAVKGTNYYWDFEDLTSEADKNDLTLSSCADSYGAGENYKLTDGVYVVNKEKIAANSDRPDFELEKPFTLDSENDWTIEWRGYTYNSSCVLMGQKHDDPTGNTTKNGYIYLASTTDFDSSADGKLYPLRFVPETGKALSLSYGNYKSTNYSMNSWKLEYTKSDNKITLYVSTDDGVTWTSVSSATAGTFSSSYETLFGRMRGNGYLNYYGQMDYIQVNFVEGEENNPVEYRWDFNDLTSSSDKNDLTLSGCADHYGAGENYDLVVDGTYVVNKTLGKTYSNRPDFTLEKPINITSEKSWVIEWKGKIYSASCLLFGPDQTDPNSSTTLYDFIYLAYTTNFGGSGEPYYPLRFTIGSKGNMYFKYGDFKSLNNSTNSWKLAYNKETNVATLYSSTDDGKTWDVVYVNVMGEFDITYYTMFGRMKGNGNYNYYGEMNYVQVAIEN